MNILLFDVGIPGGTTVIIAGVGFFFILLAAAYVMFRLLRKTVKMAFRMAMVVSFFFVFVVGGIATYWFASGSSARPERRPGPARQR
jgi:hypothetical protein